MTGHEAAANLKQAFVRPGNLSAERPYELVIHVEAAARFAADPRALGEALEPVENSVLQSVEERIQLFLRAIVVVQDNVHHSGDGFRNNHFPVFADARLPAGVHFPALLERHSSTASDTAMSP